MGLPEIVDRIARDGEAEASEALARGREKAEGIRAQARDEAASRRDRVLEEAHGRADRAREHALAQARLAGRNLVLAEKRTALDDAERLARELVLKLPAGDYLSLFARAVADRAHGDERIVLDGTDAKRLAGIADAANGALAKAGRPSKLALAPDTADIGGSGLMLVGDGTEEVITPASLVAEARLDAEPELARVLFDETADA